MAMKSRLDYVEDAGVGEKSVWNAESKTNNEELCC